MCAQVNDHDKPSLLLSALGNKCPRCRRGRLFKQSNPYRLKGLMRMNEQCPVCGQTTDMEPGFYFGTSYVSYALAVAISVATFVTWWVVIGFSLEDRRFFAWMAVNAAVLILLQPPLMRLSRTIWLSFFIHYSSDWKSGDLVHAERANEAMKNAW